MTLALYMDHHMMRQIVAGLRSRGLDVVTAYEDGADQLLISAPDVKHVRQSGVAVGVFRLGCRGQYQRAPATR